ncbi:hypothetical protein GE061_014859 [Apolygus lucorum]|uniref:Gustatory receptor n=1 Tax=Apolygus lucorum TaxID=248454 RepID=A0A8S9XM59_APOLU|nr:hypothetical protein GE061_014859 [Apolygus lucorum]
MTHAFFSLYTTIGVSISCQFLWLEKKAERFNKLLASCALKDKTERLLTNPHITMHFATQKPLKFTACNCFNIDYRLGCSMIAACVTYLVILVQIDGSKNTIPTLPLNDTTSTPLTQS